MSESEGRSHESSPLLNINHLQFNAIRKYLRFTPDAGHHCTLIATNSPDKSDTYNVTLGLNDQARWVEDGLGQVCQIPALIPVIRRQSGDRISAPSSRCPSRAKPFVIARAVTHCNSAMSNPPAACTSTESDRTDSQEHDYTVLDWIRL